ncbi:MAG: nickel pincer cofactor biosynthesis protein LarC [Saccharofermentans sp.]|nr:nickel pincer cofactor biosynthesis protein LarC [Saccharofermentans sp.]
MKTLYLDLGMGAAGDMLSAALYELIDDKAKAEFIEKMNNLGIPGVSVHAHPSTKCGVVGTHFHVTVNGEEEESHDHHHEHGEECTCGCHEHSHEHEHEHDHGHEHHHHSHSGMDDIRGIVSGLKVPPMVRLNILAIYETIAEAESKVHGVPVDHIHFHEVGSMDAVADIAAVCLLMNMIDADKVVASPIHVGSGQVHCAHGILPVPAPATALILQGMPIYGGSIKGELCTPTGAALIKNFVDEFGPMPAMTISGIGYGMGKKDFEAANCVRACLGETSKGGAKITELTCNLDDMTPEKVGFAMDTILAAGALDVYTIPINMKKNRPGLLFCVMCKEQDKEKMVDLIFKHTTTLGIRENVSNRYTLTRRVETRSTSLGPVRVKVSSGYGVERAKYEYDDLAAIAKKNNISIDDVVKLIDD